MTYESISNFMNLHESPCIAENENGETVIIERFKDDNNEYFYRMQTAQKMIGCESMSIMQMEQLLKHMNDNS